MSQFSLKIWNTKFATYSMYGRPIQNCANLIGISLKFAQSLALCAPYQPIGLNRYFTQHTFTYVRAVLYSLQLWKSMSQTCIHICAISQRIFICHASIHLRDQGLGPITVQFHCICDGEGQAMTSSILLYLMEKFRFLKSHKSECTVEPLHFALDF